VNESIEFQNMPQFFKSQRFVMPALRPVCNLFY